MRLPHAHVLQHRIAHVQADVLVVGAGRLDDLQAGSSSELVHDVRREVVDDDVHRAFAQLEAAHDVVGHDFENEAVVSRRGRRNSRRTAASSMLIVDDVADEPVRPGADRVLAKRRAPRRRGRSG